jgi:ribosomal protein L11 methyltransferase
MSFGTGHHATTWLVMEQMRNLNFAGKRVFDFGTGTGILAILAHKLGAGFIAAIDIDEWSIANAAENFANNNCTGIHQLQAETPGVIEGNFDIILANINKNILLQYIPALAKKLNKGGFLLLSGLLAEDEHDILLKTAENSLNQIAITARDKWISILLQFKIS